MELLLVLAAIYLLGVPIAVIVLFVSTSRLRGRAEAFETEAADLRKTADALAARLAAFEPPPAASAPETPAQARPEIGTAPSRVAGPAASPGEQDDEAARDPETPGEPSQPPSPQGADASGQDAAPSGQDAAAGAAWGEARPPREAAREAAAPGDFEAKSAVWMVWIAGAALALAGVFLVREAVALGWFTPTAQVLTGGALGVSLLIGAEWLRARDPAAARPSERTFHAPAALAAGGAATLFASVLAARRVFDLIGPEVSFGLMAASSAAAMALAWRHGPILAAIGLLGGYATPILVGGDADGPAWLLGYLLILTVACHGVERFKQWGWVSWSALLGVTLWGVALISAYGAEAATRVETGLVFALCAPLLGAAAIMVPAYGWRPVSDEPLPGLLAMLRRRASKPAAIAVVGALSAAGLLAWAAIVSGQITAAVVGLAALGAFAVVALPQARVLDDCAPVALGAASAALLFQGGAFGAWTPRADEILSGEAEPTIVLAFVVASAAALALAGGDRRSERALTETGQDETGQDETGQDETGQDETDQDETAPDNRAWRPLYWTAFAAFGPAALFFGFYLGRWDVFAPTSWGVGAAALAALQTFNAARIARRDGDDRSRVSIYALAALASLAGLAGMLFAGDVLNLALAALVGAAATLDRRFDLWLMSWAALAGVAILSVRLLVWPGLEAALAASPLSLSLSFLSAALFSGLAAGAFAARGRLAARIVTESAAFAFLGVYLGVLIRRAFDTPALDAYAPHFIELGLHFWVWAVLAMTALYRSRIDGPLQRVRLGLACLAAFLAALALLGALTAANPLLTGAPAGPLPLLDGLAFTYLGAAALTALGGGLLLRRGWPVPARAAAIAAGATSLIWALLETRRLWRGPDLSVPDILQGEQYSYSIVLLLFAIALILYGAMAQFRSIRMVGLSLTAAAIAKVFVIDAAGLEGLWRAASFFALGLCLVGLAWLYRRLDAQKPAA